MTEESGLRREESASGSEIVMLDASLRVRPASNFVIVPGLAYGQFINPPKSGGVGMDSTSLLSGTIEARINF